jgi:thiol-disulfide isomerase/thioredoxin
MLLSYRVNLWDNGGCVTRDLYAWWRSQDPGKSQARQFTRPEDFRLVGKSLVDGKECHVVESRAGMTRLYIDAAEHRVRRMTHFGVPNDLAEGVWLAAMRKAGKADVVSSRDWRPWLETLALEERLAAERRLSEEIFPLVRIHSEVYPADYLRVVPGGWMPRLYTMISSYPDWDAVEKTGRYTYVVDRVEVEVTELKVNEPLADESLAVRIPEGGKVYDWRFDPPVEYAFQKDRTEEEIRALAEEAKRKHEEQTAPYRKMTARIEKRLGQKAPELPRATWFNGGPMNLADLRGKAVVLHFWATWCAPCHNDIRTLVTRNTSATSRPLVIGIHDAKADLDAVKKAIVEGGMKYPICVDSEEGGEDGGSLRSWYGIQGIPHAIVIDKEGRVAGHGALDDMLERARGME